MLTYEEINFIRNGFMHIPSCEEGVCNEPGVFAAVERIVTARVSAALREAADDMGARLDTFTHGGRYTRARWAEIWLRMRADSYDRTAITEGSE